MVIPHVVFVQDTATVKAEGASSAQSFVVRQDFGENAVLRAKADGVVKVQEAETLQGKIEQNAPLTHRGEGWRQAVW